MPPRRPFACLELTGRELQVAVTFGTAAANDLLISGTILYYMLQLKGELTDGALENSSVEFPAEANFWERLTQVNLNRVIRLVINLALGGNGLTASAAWVRAIALPARCADD